MSEKKSPIAEAWDAVALNAARMQDMRDFHSLRLTEIENRLAALDGGDDADAARRSALERLERKRSAQGGRPVGFQLVGSGDGMTAEWTGSETFSGQRPPVVNVTLPEMNVTVNVPKGGGTKKVRVDAHDDQGRILEFTQSET